MDADTPPPPNGRTGGTPTRSYGGVIPADPGGRIALQLRDDRPDVWYPGQLSPFGGTTEAADASPLHAAAREAYEELGLTVRLEDLITVGVSDAHESDGQLTRCHFYLLPVPDAAALRTSEGHGTVVGRPQQLVHERTDLAWIWRDAVTVLAARQLAEQLMPCLGQRWAHVQGVAAAAIGLAPILGEQALTATAASWVHDVGYSTQIATTGFHALDGARYLAAHSWPDTLLGLVAYHTGAEWEAQQRDLSDQLTAIPRPPQHLIDAVTTADLTTGPDGSPITLAARLADILRRYPPHDPVHRAISMSSTYLTQCQARVTARVQAAASPAKVRAIPP